MNHMWRLPIIVVGLILGFGAAFAHAAAQSMPEPESPPVIISVNADSRYFVNDAAVESIAALHGVIVAATERAIMPSFYLWGDDTNSVGDFYAAFVALKGTKVPAVGLIAEPLTADPARRADAVARALLIDIGREPSKAPETRAKAVEVLLDFDGSLYWQRAMFLSRIDFEARLSAFVQHKGARQVQLLLNRLAQWCDALDAVGDIRESGAQGVLLHGGPPGRASWDSLPLEPYDRPTRSDRDLLLVNADFGGSGEPRETSHREWCVSPRRTIIVE